MSFLGWIFFVSVCFSPKRWIYIQYNLFITQPLLFKPHDNHIIFLLLYHIHKNPFYLSLSFSLSIYLFIYLSISLSIYLPISICKRRGQRDRLEPSQSFNILGAMWSFPEVEDSNGSVVRKGQNYYFI